MRDFEHPVVFNDQIHVVTDCFLQEVLHQNMTVEVGLPVWEHNFGIRVVDHGVQQLNRVLLVVTVYHVLG